MIPSGSNSGGVSVERLEKIKAVLKRNRQLWPLTVKQVYYLMVEDGQAGRGLNDYAQFMALMASALKSGDLHVESLWQPPQEVRDGGAWENKDEFVRSEVEDMLWGYRRDLMQGQPRYVEVWVEKPELADFFGAVTIDYCVSTVVCSSSPTPGFLNELRRRLENLPSGRTGVPGQKPEVVALYFGDYDSVGENVLTELQEALRSEGGFWEITLKRVALKRELVVRKNLPSRAEPSSVSEALHSGTPKVGAGVVELEALPPRSLVSLLCKSIEAEFDMELFENQKQIQTKEQAALDRLRAKVGRHISNLLRK